MLTVTIGTSALEGAGYTYPPDLGRRKMLGYVLVPLLFYGPLLAGVAMTGGDGGVSPDLLLAMAMFLSVFVGLLLLVVHSQGPWVELDGLMMRVEGVEFQVRHLVAINLFAKGRAGLEPARYIVTFDVVEPGASVDRFETHPIRSVKDLDVLVRDLQRLLPDVPYFDRTPLAEAVATHDRIEEARRDKQL